MSRAIVFLLVAAVLMCSAGCPKAPLPSPHETYPPEEYGAHWEQVTNVPEWAPLEEYRTVWFKGKLWIIGGRVEYENDRRLGVWNSPDGKSWTRVTGDVPWVGLWGHTVEVFQDKLWVIGGRSENLGIMPSVWCSENGAAWSLVTNTAPWMHRKEHATTVYDGKLWLFGGERIGYIEENDVWCSEDGETWTAVADEAPWAPRRDHRVVARSDGMYLLGGYNLTRDFPIDRVFYRDEVWHSVDGKDWTLVSDDFPYGGRRAPSAFTAGNSIYVGGGYHEISNGNVKIYRELVHTKLFADWEYDGALPETGMTRLGTPYVPVLLEHNRSLWALGGLDVWRSNLLLHSWQKLTMGVQSLQYTLDQFVSHDGYLWNLHGVPASASSTRSSIWRSGNGVDWKLVQKTTPWEHRFNQDISIAFHDKLWVFGYQGIWCSKSGTDWEHVRESVPWGAYHQLLVHNNSLWLFAGGDGVWLSDDGVNWTQRALTVDLPYVGAFVSFKGRLWLFGGEAVRDGRNLAYVNEVWSSADGLEWTLESPSAPWAPRGVAYAVACGGRIWLFNGRSGGFGPHDKPVHHRDAWVSVDGLSWTKIASETPCNTMALSGVERKPFVSHEGHVWYLGRATGEVWKSQPGGEAGSLSVAGLGPP